MNELKRLLTFRAFAPEKDDGSYPLGIRFRGEGLAGLIFSEDRLTLCKINYSKKLELTISDVVEHAVNDVGSQKSIIIEYVKSCKLQYASVLVDAPLEVMPFSGPIEKVADLQKTMQERPQVILDTLYEPDRKYLYLGDKAQPIQFVFGYERDLISDVEKIIHECGFQIARVSCPFYAMLKSLEAGNANFSAIMFFYGKCVFAAKGPSGWERVSFRNNIAEQQIEAFIKNSIDEFDHECGKTYLIGAISQEVETMLKKHFERSLKLIRKEGIEFILHSSVLC